MHKYIFHSATQCGNGKGTVERLRGLLQNKIILISAMRISDHGNFDCTCCSCCWCRFVVVLFSSSTVFVCVFSLLLSMHFTPPFVVLSLSYSTNLRRLLSLSVSLCLSYPLVCYSCLPVEVDWSVHSSLNDGPSSSVLHVTISSNRLGNSTIQFQFLQKWSVVSTF